VPRSLRTAMWMASGSLLVLLWVWGGKRAG